MSGRKKAQAAFASAVVLLFLSGLATYFAVSRLQQSEKWVLHTHEVRTALGEIDSAILRVGRARTAFVTSPAPEASTQFETAARDVESALQNLRELTADNPEQQRVWLRLHDVSIQRIDLFRKSMQLKTESPAEDHGQAELTYQSVSLNSEMTAMMQQMREQEQRLLEPREAKSHRLFILTVVILAIAFIGALELFAIHYRFLIVELDAREQAERVARESEESLRRLTGRLLQVQDAERRKFSRELHDSLGQYLAGVKMNLAMFMTQRKENLLQEAMQHLDQSIAETRTISHLLHPPLLDEAGLSSAARWYLEGFAKRSGIEINLDMPEELIPLPKPIALGLFRILQESLTNIHRHSGSTKADVTVSASSDEIELRVRDYGKGISTELLRTFRAKGSSGVGMAGMRERVRELGGQLTVQRVSPGTLIVASLPIVQQTSEPVVSAAD